MLPVGKGPDAVPMTFTSQYSTYSDIEYHSDLPEQASSVPAHEVSILHTAFRQRYKPAWKYPLDG